jgi:hypothetical protein
MLYEDITHFHSIQTDPSSRSLQYDLHFISLGVLYSVRIKEKNVKTYILK